MGATRVGSLVGYASGATSITNAYTIGAVSGGSEVGSIVGRWSASGTLNDLYWNSGLTGEALAVGFGSPDLSTVNDLAVAKMKRESSYANWDFPTTWRINENTSFPYLYYEIPPPIPELFALPNNYIFAIQQPDFFSLQPRGFDALRDRLGGAYAYYLEVIVRSGLMTEEELEEVYIIKYDMLDPYFYAGNVLDE